MLWPRKSFVNLKYKILKHFACVGINVIREYSKYFSYNDLHVFMLSYFSYDNLHVFILSYFWKITTWDKKIEHQMPPIHVKVQ